MSVAASAPLASSPQPPLPPRGEATLPRLVAAQAARTPDATALVWRRERFTYDVLQRRAERLARHLAALGVGPEVAVAVRCRRSPEMVVAVLGVLEAGGAYVPLDPAYPRERTEWILADSGAALVLTEELVRAYLAEAPPPAAPRPAAPENLAYVIYTSGSTGRPKGVAIEQRSAVNLVRWAAATFPAAQLAGMLASTSLSFDLSVFELFVPLATGGTVVLAENLLELPALAAAGEVTFVNSVPSLAAELLRAGRLPPAVRAVGLAGEALRAEVVARLEREAPAAVVWNLYGPSETTTYSTAARLARGASGRPPIGRPIAETRAHVLAAERRPVPPGEAGELYLGGAGLARGYLGRPELTAAAFVPDPFAEAPGWTPGARLYRTGDLVRELPGGALDYLGRVDHQVKIRGVRIELGEIESALDRHPAVRAAAVLARDDGGDAAGKRLVAYVVPEAHGAPPAPGELRDFLAASLPTPMLPVCWVFLDAMPLTPSGKLDRRALPAPAPDGEGAAAAPYEAPHGPVEEALAGIWAEVLELPRVGSRDDFFALGGHSLAGTRVLARVAALLGAEVPLAALFAAPTVAALAERVEETWREGPAAAPPAPPLATGARPEPLPLSFPQQRLWFLDRLAPGGAVYNLPQRLRLEGELRPAALAAALTAIVARHEALRTRFPEAAGEPVQVVAPPAPVPLPRVDLGGLPGAAAAAEAERLAAAESRRGFELAHGPLLRATLVRLDADDHHLLVNTHHIVSDGWSLGLFLAELRALYRATCAGGPARLTPLPVQYGDFAAWQRRWLTGEPLARLLARWRARLAGAPFALELPTDRPRPPVQSYRGAQRRLALPGPLAARLADLCRRHGATPFMGLLAVWAALLARWSGQEELLVASPIANRTRPEVEGLIGLFVNTLALRCDLQQEPSFAALLARLREVALDAYTHQDLPFEKLVEELQPERDLSRNPLVQVLLVLHNGPVDVPAAASRGGPFAGGPEDLPTGTAKFELGLALAPGEAGLGGTLEYATDLFDATTAERLAGQFRTLLAAAVADPDRAVADLPLLAAAEAQQLLHEWNDTGVAYGAEPLLHGLVEAQVERTPEAPAVVFAGAVLTYRELDDRANRLARHLRALGVGPETAVGICVERSLELVVGLLGILKAGGAYVPLDPQYPRERLAFMLQDALGASPAPVVLTQARLGGLLPEGGVRRVLLDAEWAEIAARPAARPEVRTHPDQLAYVIYTSGSTGRPKGAMNSHRAIANRLLWMQQAYALGPGDAVLQKTPASFDVSVWEFFWPLATGARLVVARPGGHQDPGYLVRTIVEEGITTIHFVPSMLRAFLEHPQAGRCASLRRVVASGEALPRDLEERFFARLVCPLHNLYGPTEAAVDVTYHPCRAERERPVVPIGRAVANTAIHVLDRALRPVPIGVPGELCIGGVQLARGYLGRPELTAERFAPDPCGGEVGGRLYRTGDLARRLPDGEVEYLGRLDHQVKLRGFRIELGEIEAALAQHPQVHAAAVVLRGERLVAYVAPSSVGAALGSVPTADLRGYLAERLPEHMVPTAFVALPALPLTPSGKVDRRALPAFEPAAERGTATGFLPPRTPLEQALAAIWNEVLEVPAVGAEDNFFALGGHSLLAVRVLSRVLARLGVELPLRALFEAPTVAGLAVRLREMDAGPAAGPPLEAVPRDEPLPLSFAQERLWFLHRFEPASPVYNLATLYRLDGPLDAGALAASLRALVRRHEALRTTFVEGRGGAPEQRIAPGLPLPLPVVDLSGLAPAPREETAAAAVAAESRHLFDLAAGPLVRARLLRLGPTAHQLVLNCHHAVCDGWSLEVLERELAELYAAYVAGRAPRLAPLVLQHGDYAVWQRRRFESGLLAPQLAFWRERLAGAPTLLELPADRRRPAVFTYRGALLSRPLSTPAAVALRALARGEGATLFMGALALFAALLHRHIGADDLLVGAPLANRERAELEGVIGLFVNVLPLRVALGDRPTFRELLRRARETTLAATMHQELPFERLVEELRPVRDLSRNPLVPMALLFERARPRELAPGLALEPCLIDNGTAKLDLTLHLLDAGEEVVASLEYASDLFDAATAERLFARFATLLAGAVAAPETPVDALPLLPPAERWQLLGEWGRGAWRREPPPAAGGLGELVAAQAVRTPAAAAVLWAGPAGVEQLSYGDLDRRANRLAHHLRALGVAPEARVGVALSRTPDLVVALLAVLKAGGAYVPFDSSYPALRLAAILEDARAGQDGFVLLTEERLLPRLDEALAAAPGVRVLRLDGAPDPFAGWSEEPPPPAAASSNLAYLIYTSGSTGRPKGVAIEHRSAVAFLHWARELFAPEELAGVFAATSINFDLSVFELFAPLAWGGRVVLGEDALALAGSPLAEAVTLVNTVPSAMAELLRLGAVPASVRTVNLAGEPLRRALAERVHALPQVARLWNLYGPSEDTTYSTFAPVARGAAGEPTIGGPVAGTRAYVLDPALRLCPIGVPGELCLAGAGLARGYLNRPELTARAFLPDPFAAAPGERMYRTGDLARWLPDGRLEYLGRLDHQVKVRGFRIELGEIEAVLATHPAVREAVVVAPEEEGDKRLVAYVVPQGEPADLRPWLAARLPEFMLPAAFVLLPALPLGATGKVDRCALPAPEWQDGAAGETAPRNPLEEALAVIWAEVLGGPPPGVHEDFFRRGGHSLLAARVVARVRATFGVELPLRRIFQTPTIAGLAEAVHGLMVGGGEPATAPPPLRRRPAADGAPLPLSSGQRRLWFLDRLEPGDPTFNVYLAARLTGPLDPAALARALHEVVRRHEPLRARFEERAGAPVQVIPPDLPPALPLTDLRSLRPGARAAEAERLAAAEARRPFDLARGPLLRALLLRLAAEEHWLVLALHHIVADGWSLDLLQDELAALYDACRAGRPSPLPPLPLQYSDYAAWQQEASRGEALEKPLAWWRRRLAPPPPALALPTDRPRRARAGPRRGALASARLPRALADGVRRLAAGEGATLFMVLLAAFDLLLYQLTGVADLLVGTPVANRDRAELEALIGFFADTLGLRVDLGAKSVAHGSAAAGDLTFRELLARVREAALGAYAHAEVPFERVVAALQPERAGGASPLFQVMLVLLHAPRARRRLGAATLEPLTLHNGTAQFEWTLYLEDEEEELTAMLEYDRDLFAPESATAVLAHFATLLAAAVEEPARRLVELPAAPPIGRREAAVEQAAAQALPAPAPAAPAADRAARLAERRARLSAEQRALLERRLRGGAASGAAAGAPAARISLVAIDPAGSRPPFVCVHPAGGDVLCFRPLAGMLGPAQPLYGLQSRGLLDGEEPHATIEEMAEDYLRELRRVRPVGPYLLGGWSLGGLVAFEMAQQLDRAGARPALLALLDALPRLPPLHAAGEDPETLYADDVPWLLHVAAYARSLWGKDLGVDEAVLRRLEPEERLRSFLARLRAVELLPAGGTVEHLRRLLAVFKANVRAAERYLPRPYAGRITLFRAERDGGGALPDDFRRLLADPALGWGELSAEPVEVHAVAASHLTLLAAANLDALCAPLAACLARAQAAAATAAPGQR